MIENEEDTWRKLLGVWKKSEITGLIFQIKNESIEVIKGGRLITTFPFPLFMALAPAEILEIIYKEIKNDRRN